MYLKYWRLKKKPFENSFEPDFYFLSEKANDVLNRLGYCISERKQLAAFTGDYGTGKTYLIQNLLKKYAEEKYCVFSLSVTRQLAGGKAQQFMVENESGDFPIGSIFDSVQEIKKTIMEKAQLGHHGILVIDEAHLIEDERIFDDIRLLLNANFEYKPIVTVILVGHTRLQQALANLPQLKQRLTVNCYLQPYNDVETTSFIRYRLRQAGCRENMFTEEALLKIHQISEGLPRKINNVCDLALVLAFMRRRKPIDNTILDAINNENSILFKQPGIPDDKKSEEEIEDPGEVDEDRSENEQEKTKLHFDSLVEPVRSEPREPEPAEEWPRSEDFDPDAAGQFRFSAMKQLSDEESGKDALKNPLEKFIKPESVSKKVDGLKNKQDFQQQDPMNNDAGPSSEISSQFRESLEDDLSGKESDPDNGFADISDNNTLHEYEEEIAADTEALLAQENDEDFAEMQTEISETAGKENAADAGVIRLGDDLTWTLSNFIFPTLTDFFKQVKSGKNLSLDKLNVVVETIINIVNEGDELLVRMFNSTGSHSMEEHSVNVAGLAASVARTLKMRQNEIEELVLAALLHDIGILKIAPEIVFKKGQLKNNELDAIKEHPYLGADLVHLFQSEKYHSFMPTLRTVILQEHEREGGIGYPMGLSGDEIHKYAKIIGLCDVFEASCFRRKERKSTLIYNTIKKIIDLDEKYFATSIKKGLIKKLTLYPLSSYVQLNSGEIGCVIQVSREHPLRPILEMVTDADQNRLEKTENRDLLKTPFLFIEKVVDKEDIY